MLENIIERAIGITLASQGNNSQQHQRRRKPRFQARNSRIPSPEDIPVIPNPEIRPRPGTPVSRSDWFGTRWQLIIGTAPFFTLFLPFQSRVVLQGSYDS